MPNCCSETECAIEKHKERQRSTLIAVLGINITMFVVEMVAGLLASSTALLADSLDMLGDSLVYGFSIYVVTRDDIWKARSALLKGAIMAGFGLFVLGQAGYKLLYPAVPQFETIGLVGLIALGANALCLALLWSHREDDVNMRSVWLCSRNDIIANVSVLGAALAVWMLNSQAPDILVGLAISVLFLHSAFRVVRDALTAYSAQNRITESFESSPDH